MGAAMGRAMFKAFRRKTAPLDAAAIPSLPALAARGRGLWRGFVAWTLRVRLRSKLMVVLVTLSVASGIATYVAMTQAPLFGHDPTAVMILLLLDLGFLAMLGTIIAQRMFSIWLRQQAQSGRLAPACAHGQHVYAFGGGTGAAGRDVRGDLLLFRRGSVVSQPRENLA